MECHNAFPSYANIFNSSTNLFPSFHLSLIMNINYLILAFLFSCLSWSLVSAQAISYGAIRPEDHQLAGGQIGLEHGMVLQATYTRLFHGPERVWAAGLTATSPMGKDLLDDYSLQAHTQTSLVGCPI
jgi:hypothetical protein